MNKSSLYANALVALYEVLDGADYPVPHPGRSVGVALGGFQAGEEEPAESVTVLTTLPLDEQQDWASLGCDSHDEQFVITVAVSAVLPAPTARDALVRLNEITGAVETAVRSTSGAAGTTRHELVAEHMQWWHPIAVDPWIGPHPNGEGWAAECSISVGVRARI